MTDPTAGRSAGTPLNAEFDPMGRSDEANRRLASDDPRAHERAKPDPSAPTAGRSGETAHNVEQEPGSVDEPELPA